MKKYIIHSFAFLLAGSLVVSCDKEEAKTLDVDNAESLVGFVGAAANLPTFEEGDYFYEIEVGSTKRSNSDRTVVLELNEELTTALPGEYTIDESSYVIPAGDFVSKIKVTSNYDALPPLTKRTLVFDLVSVEGQDAVDEGKTRFTLVIFRACPINRDELLGIYEGVEDATYTYDVVATAGEADNEIILSNVWEADPASTTHIFINNDPGNPTVSFPDFQENYLYDNPTYGAAYVDGNASGVPGSTFDPCDKTFNLNFKVRVSAGTFATTNLILTKLD